MQNMRDTHLLEVGIPNSTAALEHSSRVPHNLKHAPIIQPSRFIPRYLPKRNKVILYV